MDRLKVFLSSTQRDLQAERDSAEAVISELGHHCLRAETFDSPGTSSEDACRHMARSSDVYIGIFGSRYGFKVPRLGVSATEFEYKEARATNPGKIFIYVQDADVLDEDQKRFLQDVQDFSGGYFRHEKFQDCERLKEQIRRDVITWTTRRVRDSLAKEIEVRALRDKVAHLSRVMELYGLPEDLRK